MPMSEEIKAGVERMKRQRALIADMATVKPVANDTWNFCLTREQLEDFLESLNAELAADDHTHDDA